MGKEVKIGLAVILILLITFGVVLAKRLSRPLREDTPASTSQQTADRRPKASAGKAAKASVEPVAEANSTKTTLVPAKTDSGKTSKGNEPDASQWTVVPDSVQTAQSAPEPVSKVAPPSYMPNASLTASDLYRQGDGRQQSAAAEQAGDGRLSDSGALAQAEPRLQNHTALMPPADPSGPASPPGGSEASAKSNQSAISGAAGATPPPTLGQYSPGNTATGRAPEDRQSPLPSYSASTDAFPAPTQDLTSQGPWRTGSPSGLGDVPREDGQYEVQPNDNYWVISERLYGTGAYFKALAEHNRDLFPQENRLQVGDVIAAPSIQQLQEAYAWLCPKPGRHDALLKQASGAGQRRAYGSGRVYPVQEGDTLYEIARWELGKAARWVEIYRLNQDVLGNDYDYLVPGTELILPEAEPADTLTQRPDQRSAQRR